MTETEVAAILNEHREKGKIVTIKVINFIKKSNPYLLLNYMHYIDTVGNNVMKNAYTQLICVCVRVFLLCHCGVCVCVCVCVCVRVLVARSGLSSV